MQTTRRMRNRAYLDEKRRASCRALISAETTECDCCLIWWRDGCVLRWSLLGSARWRKARLQWAVRDVGGGSCGCGWEGRRGSEERLAAGFF